MQEIAAGTFNFQVSEWTPALYLHWAGRPGVSVSCSMGSDLPALGGTYLGRHTNRANQLQLAKAGRLAG